MQDKLRRHVCDPKYGIHFLHLRRTPVLHGLCRYALHNSPFAFRAHNANRNVLVDRRACRPSGVWLDLVIAIIWHKVPKQTQISFWFSISMAALPPSQFPYAINLLDFYSDSRSHGYQGPFRYVRYPRLVSPGGGCIAKSEDGIRCAVAGKECAHTPTYRDT